MEPEHMDVCRDPSIGEGSSAGQDKVCVPHCQAKMDTLHFLVQEKNRIRIRFFSLLSEYLHVLGLLVAASI
jgi:hypothetical protein